MLFTLNSCNAICQLYLNKNGGRCALLLYMLPVSLPTLCLTFLLNSLSGTKDINFIIVKVINHFIYG